MKTVYCLVVLLALTLVPEPTEGWFFRAARRIRINVYHKLGCMAACRWARSWACKACKRKRALDVGAQPDEEDPAVILGTLDLNGDGFVQLHELAKVLGVKATNPHLIARFSLADADGDGKLSLAEIEPLDFDNKAEFLADMNGATDTGDDDVTPP